MPEVATDHFGLRLSSYGADRLLKYLWNPREQARPAPPARRRAGEAARRGRAGGRGAVLRFPARDACSPSSPSSGCARRALPSRGSTRPLLALIKAVGTLADRLDEGRDRDELLEQRGRLTTYRTGLRQFLGLSAEDHVHWAERSGRKRPDRHAAHRADRRRARTCASTCCGGGPRSSSPAPRSRWAARSSRSSSASAPRTRARWWSPRPSTTSATCGSTWRPTCRCPRPPTPASPSTP